MMNGMWTCNSSERSYIIPKFYLTVTQIDDIRKSHGHGGWEIQETKTLFEITAPAKDHQEVEIFLQEKGIDLEKCSLPVNPMYLTILGFKDIRTDLNNYVQYLCYRNIYENEKF